MEDNLYLIHYTDPDYDAEYQHNYYMAHRKLKGYNRSELNDAGKEKMDETKFNLNLEKKNKIKESSDTMNSKIASSKSNMESTIATSKSNMESKIATSKSEMESNISNYTEQMNSKISTLQARLSKMSTAAKKQRGHVISEEIAKLREENAAKKEELEAAYSTSAEEYRSEHASNKEAAQEEHSSTSTTAKEEHSTNKGQYAMDYLNDYAAELEKIFSDSQYLKSSTSSATKKGDAYTSRYSSGTKWNRTTKSSKK